MSTGSPSAASLVPRGCSSCGIMLHSRTVLTTDLIRNCRRVAVLGGAAFVAAHRAPVLWLPVGVVGIANAILSWRAGHLAPAVLLHGAHKASCWAGRHGEQRRRALPWTAGELRLPFLPLLGSSVLLDAARSATEATPRHRCAGIVPTTPCDRHYGPGVVWRTGATLRPN
jgi:hypothetical protein